MTSADSPDHAGFSQSILRLANGEGSHIDFLKRASEALLDHLNCDAIDLWVRGPGMSYAWEYGIRPEAMARFRSLPRRDPRRSSAIERLYFQALSGRVEDASAQATARGGYWSADAPGAYGSIALIPFAVDRRAAGVLGVKYGASGRMTSSLARTCDRVAQAVGLAVATRAAQWALRERVKELTCLYEIGRIAQDSEITADEALQRIVEVLPPAWQFPEIAGASIRLDDRRFVTAGFRKSRRRQGSPIEVKGAVRGSVEVVYTAERPEFAERVFLREERRLIDTIAREVSLIVARREMEEHEAALRGQLRHADRLATIGQLAAGVAHELNEPLSGMLGFAQLAQKTPGLPEAAARDLERIIAASLHARDVIQKLLVFARQKPPAKTAVDLNGVIGEALCFLESRCAQAGIAIATDLERGLPEIHADASQMRQVLVNLVVNSIQAMPDGGEIRIRTRSAGARVQLRVEDTGIGMSEEVQEKIFTPFFTTKDVNEGTGLGLAVVHGIVTSHGGVIRVESAPGKGACMEVELPNREMGRGAAQ